MKRILVFGLGNNLGGIESFIINTYREINHEKFQLDFIKYSDTVCFEDEIIKSGGKFFRLKSRSESIILHYIQLFCFFLKNRNFSYVHINLQSASDISAVWISRIFKLKTIVHSHSSYEEKFSLTLFLHKLNRNILSLLRIYRLACSDKAGLGLFMSKKFNIIKNGIKIEKYKYNDISRFKTREILGIDNETQIIGHVGSFRYPKNHHFIIDVFYEFLKKNANSVLLLVGDGELKNNIQEKIKNLNIEDNVVFTGVQENINEIMCAMDVFLFPSHYEGLGIVLLEAQSNGLKCYVSDAIPYEVKVTSLITSLSLKLSARQWAEELYNNFENNNLEIRSNYNDQVAVTSFSSKSAAKHLMQIYSEL